MKILIRMKQQNMYTWYLSTGLSYKLNITCGTWGQMDGGAQRHPRPSPRAPTAQQPWEEPKPERQAEITAQQVQAPAPPPQHSQGNSQNRG